MDPLCINMDSTDYVLYPLDHRYHVYRDGRVFSTVSNKWLKQRLSSGYWSINIQNKTTRVHRLVAMCFLEPTSHTAETLVDHIDGNKLNNNGTNLRWSTSRDNCMGNHCKNHNTTPVIQLTLDNKEVARFSSIAEAAKETGSSHYMIQWCVREKNQHKDAAATDGYRYRWRRVDKTEKTSAPENGRSLDGFPNYLIYSNGSVYSKAAKRLMSLQKNSDGYMAISFVRYENKKRIDKKYLVHRLVAELFIEGKPENWRELTVNHKDGNKANNCVDNLEWATHREQSLHTAYSLVNNVCKEVIMLDLTTGRELDRFPSCVRAAKFIGATTGHIANCCRGVVNSAVGYGWKYA